MRARWFFVLAIVLFISGVIVPIGMYMHDMQNETGLSGIFWIIVAPAIYAPIAIPFWIAGFILLIAGIWRWKHG